MARAFVDRWKGRTVACIASGPSLTAADCDAVRAAGLPTIVTNTTFRLCPWADVLFGFDCKWWEHYHAETAAAFAGERMSWCPGAARLGITALNKATWFRHFNNSGASSISLAICAGAARVILLGYDCQRTDGKAHWHGDHPGKLGNARSMHNWPTHFKNVARLAGASHVQVLNASRATALTVFPRVALADVLADVRHVEEVPA